MSPVITITRMPALRQFIMASITSTRGGSSIPTTPTNVQFVYNQQMSNKLHVPHWVSLHSSLRNIKSMLNMEQVKQISRTTGQDSNDITVFFFSCMSCTAGFWHFLFLRTVLLHALLSSLSSSKQLFMYKKKSNIYFLLHYPHCCSWYKELSNDPRKDDRLEQRLVVACFL